MKRLFYFFVFLSFIFAATLIRAHAQEKTDGAVKVTEEKKSNEFRFWVKHDHLRKLCEGELVINDKGIEYITDFEKHTRYWDFIDIKMLKLISKTEIEVKTYTTYRPELNLDQALNLGSDESFRFILLEGELTQGISEFLLSKIKKPIATTFVETDDKTAPPVFTLPVRHRHRWGGCPGILKVYEDKIIYQSNTEPKNSRLWRWSDLQSLGRSSRFKFEITTFEPEILGGPEKSYNFDLKEEMTDEMYDFLWKKFYKVTYYAPASRKPKSD